MSIRPFYRTLVVAGVLALVAVVPAGSALAD
jgi:hypothetical protein